MPVLLILSESHINWLRKSALDLRQILVEPLRNACQRVGTFDPRLRGTSLPVPGDLAGHANRRTAQRFAILARRHSGQLFERFIEPAQ